MLSSLIPDYEFNVGLLKLHSELGMDVHAGVRRYLCNRRWRWSHIDSREDLARVLGSGCVDGVIGVVDKPETAELLRESSVPTVNVSGMLTGAGLPRAGVDDLEVGRTAARHLADAGFRRFLFFGFRNHGYSQLRRKGFEEALAQLAPVAVDAIEMVDDGQPEWPHQQLREFLADSPKPLGVFACRDPMGIDVCRLAAAGGVHVPTAVGVVAVDNIRSTCEFHSPSLSSVALPWEDVGHVAGQMLDAMMQGGNPSPEPVLLHPMDVVRRESSDIVAIEDPLVRQAVRIIEQRGCDGLRVEDLAEELRINRQSLRELFQERVGRSPSEFLRSFRLERARKMLLQTRRPLAQVSLDCGFCSQSHFTKAFRRHTGQTPASYRATHQRCG